MSTEKNSRRKFLIGGAAAVVGLPVAARLAEGKGLLPPDSRGIYGLGESLNYAAHRLVGRDAMAREFPRSAISEKPFANGRPLKAAAYVESQAKDFADWNLTVDGMVDQPMTLSLADVRQYPVTTQITHLACEEGWSYIAEWGGVQLSHVLDLVKASPRARYAVYFSIQKPWWDSLDLEEARHPQTLIAWQINGANLPAQFGGPLRMRVPRQLGYKSVKYLSRITLTDDIRKFGKGLGGGAPEGGYAWYAGI